MTTESGRVLADQALVASDEARSDLHPSGFDPSRGLTPLQLAGKAMEYAWNYLRRPDDPPFDDVKSDHRILAMATALVATEHLFDALKDIRRMATPGANATVRRMAARAASAIEAAPAGETHSGSTEGKSATAEGGDAHD